MPIHRAPPLASLWVVAAMPAQNPPEAVQPEPVPWVAELAAVPGQRPQPIAPGGAGHVVIVLALRSDAVLLPDTPFSVAYERSQGPLALGPWRRPPPEPGKLYEPYRGRAVYEDTVLVEIPVTVAAGTRDGEYAATVRVASALHDGESAERLEAFEQEVKCPVLVGASPIPVEAAPTTGRKAATGEDSEPSFALAAPTSVSLPVGGRQSFAVRLAIPAGVAIGRDAELGVPRVEITGLGRGVACELGGEPDPLEAPEGPVWVGVYARTVTSGADADAAVGPRQPSVRIHFASRSAGATDSPRALHRQFLLEITAGGAGGVAYEVEPGAPPIETSGEVRPPGERSEEEIWILAGLAAVAVGFVALLVLRPRASAVYWWRAFAMAPITLSAV